MSTRFISLFLAINMMLSSVAVSFNESAIGILLSDINSFIQLFEKDNTEKELEGFGDFYNELSDLLEKHSDEKYFQKIVIDTENNTITRDGEPSESLDTYGVNYSAVASVNPVIAVEALLDAMKIENTIDSVSENITAVFDNSKTTLSTEFRKLSSSASEKTAFISTDDLEEELLVKTELSDGKIIITSPYQTKRLIVQTKNGKKLSKSYGAEEKISDGNGCYVLQFKTEKDTKAAYDKISNESFVDYVVCDTVSSVAALSDRQGAKLIQSDRYKLYLKENNKTTKITVAVLDTGVDTTHPFLKSRITGGYDATKKKTTVKDGNGHGSHVAGIIVDNTPSNVKIMPVKVLGDNGSGTSLQVRLGIEYAIKKGVQVINMSLGGTCAGKGCQQCAAVNKALDAGIKVVVAAGNEASDTKYTCPAKIEDCITVGSCSYDTVTMSYYSNYGSSVDITAPGENIYSCLPGGDYAEMSGTSMATPFASAAVAMLLVNKPSLTVAQVESKIKSYCTDMLTPGWDKYSGEGIINFGIFFGDNVQAETVYTPTDTITMSYFGKCAQETASLYIEGKDGLSDILTNRSFTVKSSNSKIAVFDGKFIIPKGNGKATITVTIPNGKSASFDVVLNKKEVWTDYAASKYEKGDGSKSNPYIISNAKQLAKFAADMRNGKNFKGKYLKLSKDIDLKGKYWISAGRPSIDNGWISLSDSSFMGTFDGANHKIKNMTIFDESPKEHWYSNNVPNIEWYEGNTGFITSVQGGTVKRLGIENGFCERYNSALLITDLREGSTVRNCYTTGFCRGAGLFGEIVNYDIEVSNCFSSAVVGNAGIANWIYSSNDKRGSVVISNTFFCGTQMDISERFTHGAFANKITGNKETKQTYIYNCFSTTEAVWGSGFSGEAEYSKIYNCYYNKKNTDGINKNIGSSIELKGVSQSFFKSKSNFTSSSKWDKLYKWDFDDTWAISSNVNGGYPYLKKIKPSATTSFANGTWLDYAAESFGGGNGTKASPYLIKNAEQLARIAKLYYWGGGIDKYFKLTADIDLSDHYWTPIAGGQNIGYGDTGSVFSGHIDGNGKTIHGMKIKSDNNNVGFITHLFEGSINNLNFENADVNGKKYVGIIVGSAGQYSTLYNCSASGKVNADEMAGGVAGQTNATCKTIGLKSTAEVITSDDQNSAGGIIGICYGTVEACIYIAPTITGSSFGGIFNWGFNSAVKNCASIGARISGSNSYVTASYQIFEDEGMIFEKNYSDEWLDRYTTEEMKNTSLYKGFDFSKSWNASPGIDEGYPVPVIPTLTETVVSYPTKLWKDVKASSFAGGKGTKSSPYLIENAKQLAYMVYSLDVSNKYNGKYFRLTNDIDLGGRLWSDEIIIATSVVTFYFDGDGHTISNLTSKNGEGLFYLCMDKGEIANLNVENIKNAPYGIIKITSGTIRNCSVSGNLSSSTIRVQSCSSSQVGGICLDIGGLIENCSVDITASGDGNVAGIAGYDNGSSRVRNCFVRATFNSNGASPFIANSASENIRNCLAVTNIRRENFFLDSSCYISSEGSRSHLNLKDKSTYKNWDFSSIWAISENKNDGYPYLRGPKERKITYSLSGGKLSGYYKKSYIPSYQYILPTPTKSGYVFDGWYKESSYKNKVSVVGAADDGNIKVYAKWKKAYTVTFYSNYGDNKKISQAIPVSEKTALLSSPFTRTGYTFLGWAKSKDGKVVYKNGEKVYKLASQGKAVKLYAKWKPKTYEVLFDSNGGSGIMNGMDCQKFTYDVSQKLAKCTYKPPKGKVFAGWSVNNPDVLPTYTNGENVKNLSTGKDVELYACWVKPETHKIYYDFNGGKMSSGYSKTFKSGTGYTLPKPTRSGYKFMGWYDNSTFEGDKLTSIKPWITKDISVYARWKKL